MTNNIQIISTCATNANDNKVEIHELNNSFDELGDNMSLHNY